LGKTEDPIILDPPPPPPITVVYRIRMEAFPNMQDNPKLSKVSI
jgi:hypothetical protein